MSCGERITFEELIEGLLIFFSVEKEKVNIEEVIAWFDRYEFKPEDIAKFAKWDKYKYTRNLIHDGNEHFNLILMCWPEGSVSPVHDHANSHCFVRILDGTAKEIRYHWPEDVHTPENALVEMGETTYPEGNTTYMSDELGLHKVMNASHTNKLCSMHLYSPPFAECSIFDARTSKRTKVPMVFYSKFGERQELKKTSDNKKLARKWLGTAQPQPMETTQ